MIHLQKILFPTDFSKCAEQALGQALYMAESNQAELHMLHAIALHGDAPPTIELHFPNLDEIEKKIREDANAKMSADIETRKTKEVNIQKVQKRGIAAAPVIVEYAKTNQMDLIIMGTHGRRGLGRLLLGSVAEEVVRLASCPVLTVREQEEPRPAGDVQRILVPVDFSEHSEKAFDYAMQLAKFYNAKLQLLHVIEETVHPAFYTTGKTSIFEFIPDIKTKSEEAFQNLLNKSGETEIDAEFHVTEGNAAGEISRFAEKNQSDLIVISTHGLTGIEHFLIGSVAEKVVRMAPCPVFTVKAFG